MTDLHLEYEEWNNEEEDYFINVLDFSLDFFDPLIEKIKNLCHELITECDEACKKMAAWDTNALDRLIHKRWQFHAIDEDGLIVLRYSSYDGYSDRSFSLEEIVSGKALTEELARIEKYGQDVKTRRVNEEQSKANQRRKLYEDLKKEFDDSQPVN